MYIFPYNDNIEEVNSLERHFIENNIFVMNGSSFGVDSSLRILLPNNRSDLNKFVNILETF